MSLARWLTASSWGPLDHLGLLHTRTHRHTSWLPHILFPDSYIQYKTAVIPNTDGQILLMINDFIRQQFKKKKEVQKERKSEFVLKGWQGAGVFISQCVWQWPLHGRWWTVPFTAPAAAGLDFRCMERLPLYRYGALWLSRNEKLYFPKMCHCLVILFKLFRVWFFPGDEINFERCLLAAKDICSNTVHLFKVSQHYATSILSFVF